MMNFSAAGVTKSGLHAAPTVTIPAAGFSGMIFKRGPTMHARQLGTSATPLPASTAAIRLVTPSCSSANRSLNFIGANSVAKSAWYSG